MNERIKELLEEAGFKVNWQHEDVQAIKMARFEKFAELIIKECADIANAGIDPAESHLIGDDILEHFGVEE